MYEMSQTKRSFRIKMTAELANIDRADDQLAAFLQAAEAPYDHFGLRILLREALLNAVTHGSGEDPGKKVELTFTFDEENGIMTVRDQGPGFAWREQPCRFDTLDEGGRGLALMKVYSDNMTFNDKGNEIILVKHGKIAESISR